MILFTLLINATVRAAVPVPCLTSHQAIELSHRQQDKVHKLFIVNFELGKQFDLV
jgi:hypothetical protein